MAVMAWQGWRIELPGRWNPVKLEGDYDQGYALLADLHRPRLGIRWSTPRPKKFDPDAWAPRAMREEVGQLAAAEATTHAMPRGEWQASTLYLEPEPPGRDVWVGYSPASKRVIELIHHAHRRERILADTLLPTLADLHGQAMMPWAVFELSCIVPAELKLTRQQLNAGDLSLTFGARRRTITVRQVAVAKLALTRMPIEKWIAQQQGIERKHYRPMKDVADIELAAGPRPLKGKVRGLRRRRRWFWMRSLARQMMTMALHDATRDRLVIVQGSDEALCRQIAATVGWAGEAKVE